MAEVCKGFRSSTDDGSAARPRGRSAVLRKDDSAAVLASAAQWVGCIGRAGFAQEGLHALQGALQAASWSVYELRPGLPPLLHLSASCGVADRTQDCFAAYARGLWRRDTSFDTVRHQGRPETPAVTAMHADEAPSADHRDAIYRAHQVLERFSVAAPTAAHTLLAVNVYRHEHQGRFSPRERERFEGLAPILFSGVQRHLAWRSEAAARAPVDVRSALLADCPRLTARELDVCERLLRGWSLDGIAADLQLRLSSVRTYRARAYTRLGVHFRSELFARYGKVAEGLPVVLAADRRAA